MKKILHARHGFTLLEVLLVVAAIGILAGIVIVAVNPGKQLGDTRNAQRKVDVNTILNAVYQYSLDNNGALPTSIDGTTREICETGASSCTGLADLSVLTTQEKYLVAIPKDPSGGLAANGTGYQIATTTGNRVKVSAPRAEQGATISATR